jgi:hypothetical protein
MLSKVQEAQFLIRVGNRFTSPYGGTKRPSL